ncbi:MAG: SAM-dependent methyltransferase [Janthinobacterium lividum]
MSGGGKVRSGRTRDAAHFDRLYDADPDPWGFRTSAYEHAKYDVTLGALPGRRFRSALEVGCSIGELTRRLAGRCDRVLGVDLSAAALRAAEAACAGLGGVGFRQAAVPGGWPEGVFDLVVLSEVLYFLVPGDLAEVARRCVAGLDAGGVVLLVNWTGATDDPLSGDQAAELFIAGVAPRLRAVRQERHEGFRLDLLGE